MEKKLLLLGLLRSQEMHGYQLNEFIENSLPTCIEIKKPTAYYILNKMLADKWVTYTDYLKKQSQYHRQIWWVDNCLIAVVIIFEKRSLR